MLQWVDAQVYVNILLDNFIKHKPLISEEWLLYQSNQVVLDLIRKIYMSTYQFLFENYLQKKIAKSFWFHSHNRRLRTKCKRFCNLFKDNFKKETCILYVFHIRSLYTPRKNCLTIIMIMLTMSACENLCGNLCWRSFVNNDGDHCWQTSFGEEHNELTTREKM